METNEQKNAHASAILTVQEMYAADQAAVGLGKSSIDLMEAAGEAITSLIQNRWALCPIVILCGPGNNGGDGFVVARLLLDAGWDVRVALYGDASGVKGDAAKNLKRWTSLGEEIAPFDVSVFEGRSLVVDAMFGAGLDRALDESTIKLVKYINDNALTCIAVDIPSGINGDTGEIMGDESPNCAATVTFFREKPGHLLFPGREYCGDLTVADIGIPETVLKNIAPDFAKNTPVLWRLNDPTWNDHKYTRGHALIVGGGEVTGAARLAGRAARRIGAGLLTLAVPSSAIPIYASSEPGALIAALDSGSDLSGLLADDRKNAVLIGPGVGVDPETAVRVLKILASDKPVVLDADALSVFEDDLGQLFNTIQRRAAPVVITPHAGEFKRLFGGSSGNKLDRALAAAKISGAFVVFKGPDTVIADPAGRAAISVNAPPWLATGGTGDVLAGLILGLLAQGMSAWGAACAGVWLQGEAARKLGRGLIAEDIPEVLPSVLQAL